MIRTELFKTYAIIYIERPEKLNALDFDTMFSLDNTILELCKNENLKVLIITGSGKSFSVGANLNSMRKFDEQTAKKFSLLGHKIMNDIENCNKVIIAAINGYAFGGGLELALACDLRVAVPSAKLGQTEINVGVVTGFGGTERLIAYVGLGKARELLLLGKMLDAEEAKQLGIVNTIAENALTEAIHIAEKLSKANPDAISAYKRIIKHNSFNYEIDEFARLIPRSNTKEGISAFLEKREPHYQ